MRTFYRIANEKTEQGLWYNLKGEFTGLIHKDFSFCMNSNLQMPFDNEIIGWLSATDTLEDLFNWFSIEDIKQLETHGYFITIYKASKFKPHKNHLVICQHTSQTVSKLPISELHNYINS